MAVAYHSDMRKAGPNAQIIAVTHQWGDYYTRRAKEVLAGTWKSGNVWGGMKEGMVRVGDFGPRVPAAVQAEVLARQKDIAAGKLQPFAAGKTPVMSSSGAVAIPAQTQLSDAQILGMNFLVQGVQGSLPK